MAGQGSITPPATCDYAALALRLKAWGREFGFQQVGIADTDLGLAEERLTTWLRHHRHGDMDYLAHHGTKRSRPTELLPGTLRVISVRMDYLPEARERAWATLGDPTAAYVSRCALGRDYHKVLRRRLRRLAERIRGEIGDFGYRIFVDSAPVLEKPLAEKAGLGWTGKHTILINAKAGSWFFLGELYTNLPLPPDPPASDHCGTCHACMDVCPTRAIVAPYVLDARRCISYLTIELKGSIPLALRPLIGNRIYGCDDCQLVCPWNRFARPCAEPDFGPRQGFDRAPLLEQLFSWSEPEFLKRAEGSAIRRIGHCAWLRNLAVALGNGPASTAVTAALRAHLGHPNPLVREHVAWALRRQSLAKRLSKKGP